MDNMPKKFDREDFWTSEDDRKFLEKLKENAEKDVKAIMKNCVDKEKGM